MPIFLHTLGVLGLTLGLVLFSYIDRVYREMDRVTTRRIHEHIDTFESDIEPRLHLDRPRATLAFSLITRLWLSKPRVASSSSFLTDGKRSSK